MGRNPWSWPLHIESPSLDPDDWAAFRALCHDLVDQALKAVEGVRDRPVWQPMPGAVRAALREAAPRSAQGAERVGAEFLKRILPYANGNLHPRFFGWVHGAGTPVGALAEFLAASMNANVGGRDHGAVHVERQVIEWCKEIFGFPAEASGLLVSGTSMATLIGLTVARNVLAEGDVRDLGLLAEPRQLVCYASQQVHGSVAKALELLGIGRRGLRLVPVDAGHRLIVEELHNAIRLDRAEGRRPFAVVGTAGTVNIGASDPLAELASLCRAEGLWLHVDGAFGALSILAPGRRGSLEGIEQADSLAFDFHKWLHVPYDAGCILVRRGGQHRASFAREQDYLAAADRGLAGGAPWFCDFGPELSRGFRALKVWFTIKTHGLDQLGRAIAANCDLAARLAGMVREEPCLDLLAPVPLNIVCFRYRGDGLPEPVLDRINGDIVADLQERGIAAPSTTRVGGRLAIRACICNHRTRPQDLEILLEAVRTLGRQREAESSAVGQA
ncbi:MAG: cytochrome D ubiquinol oxidase subunit I [Alphaproteobacteria bacterium]|nr:cytochrome D ubiquinol oxidase subunit I [Alphaproteobacteria bacterium]